MNVMQPIKRSFGPSWPEVPQGLGMAPTSGIFQVSAGAGTWKIRKCIDTCIACRLAQHTNAQQYLRIIKYHVQNCSLVSYVSI